MSPCLALVSDGVASILRKPRRACSTGSDEIIIASLSYPIVPAPWTAQGSLTITVTGQPSGTDRHPEPTIKLLQLERLFC